MICRTVVVIFVLWHCSLFSQSIEMKHVFGYDCTMQLDNEEVRGGCTGESSILFNANKSGKKLVASTLASTKLKRPFINGKLNRNINVDSINTTHKKYCIDDKELQNLLNYIETVEFEKKTSSSNLVIDKVIHGRWDMDIFKYEKRDFRAYRKSNLTPLKTMDNKQIWMEYKTALLRANDGLLVVSGEDRLLLIINYKESKIKLSQSNPGGTNLTWNVYRDQKQVDLISPELNVLVYALMPDSFSVKNKLIEFRSRKELIEYLK